MVLLQPRYGPAQVTFAQPQALEADNGARLRRWFDRCLDIHQRAPSLKSYLDSIAHPSGPTRDARSMWNLPMAAALGWTGPSSAAGIK